MTGAGSGGGGGYDYVEASYPSGADEGESLYHLTENAAFVYSGTEWIEQTVTDHSQLSGVNEGDHRSDSRVSKLAPLQSVNGRTGDVTGLFEASNYPPAADTDGSNISVGYADNAGALGGVSPGNYARQSDISQYAVGREEKRTQEQTLIGYNGSHTFAYNYDTSGDGFEASKVRVTTNRETKITVDGDVKDLNLNGSSEYNTVSSSTVLAEPNSGYDSDVTVEWFGKPKYPLK